MFVFVKTNMKRTPKKIYSMCLGPNLGQASLCIFMKSMKISSKYDPLPTISQSGVDLWINFKKVFGSPGSQGPAKPNIFIILFAGSLLN